MTKFYATVCLPAQPDGEVTDAVAAALARYDAHVGDDYNEQWEWDWWHIRGDLPVRPEHDGDPRLVHNPVHRDGTTRPRQRLRCDGGPKRMLDLDALRSMAADEARAQWRAWTELARQHPPAEPLSVLLTRYGDADEARAAHLAQPLVQEVAQRAILGDPHFGTYLLLTDPVAHFAGTEQEHADRAARQAFFTAALVTLDGRWVDAHRMGDGRADHLAYDRFRAAYLDELDGDAVIVHVLCHC
ncbi:hypothetical protein ABZ570_15310 [Micromonospora sp. NPDC007271]|uniref:hypothetical protein n=1 Tax=Micromonospora sp. NPDC007271 TaxID=3154587 RepID=UPI0034063FE1